MTQSTKQHRVVIVFAAICFLLVFRGSGHGQDLQSVREAVSEGRDLALGELEAFRGSYLSEVTLQTPSISDDGSIVGTSTFAGKKSRVVLHYTASNQGIGRWMLAVKLPVKRLGDVAPAVKGTVLDQLLLATPILIFAKQSTQLASEELAPAVREFYDDVYRGKAFRLSVQEGVNLLTSASLQGDIEVGSKLLGLDLKQLVLHGSLLKNFDGSQLQQAKRDGRLAEALGRDAELRAQLEGLTIKGLPEEFQIHRLAFLVTGKPTVGIEFYMTAGKRGSQRDFRCQASFISGEARKQGGIGVVISAQSDTDEPWVNALGIDGLVMRGLTLEIRYETSAKPGPPKTLIGATGTMQFGDKNVEVTGGFRSKSGVLIGFFKGSINSIHRDDLIAVVNDAHTAAGGQAADRIDARTLPEFEFRDVAFSYAPLGGSELLGIETGIGLKGELLVFGSSLGAVDVFADATQPLIRIEAHVNEFDIGPIAMRDTSLDVRMAKPAESYFRFSGGARVMEIEASAEANLTASKTVVSMHGKVADAWQADVLFQTPTLENPVWEFQAVFADEGTGKLGSLVAQDLRGWAEKAKGEFDKAVADINKAKQDVKRINTDIAKTIEQVESERKTHEAALKRAQADVQRLESNIRQARQTVERERELHLRKIREAEADVQQLQQKISDRRKEVLAQRSKDLAVHQRDVNNAKKSYDAAESAFKKAESAWRKEKNPFKKVKLGVTKDAKGVARDAKKAIYLGARKKYDAAKAIIDKIPVDKDPKIIALQVSLDTSSFALRKVREAHQKVTRGVSVDADPRVAGLIAARKTATGAVSAAQKAFELAHRVPVEADPRVAALLTARETALASLNAAEATVNATNDTIQVASKILASAAEGKIFSIESIRMRGKVDVYEAGGLIELVAQVRLLDQPESVKLMVNSSDLTPDKLVERIAAKVIPKG